VTRKSASPPRQGVASFGPASLPPQLDQEQHDEPPPIAEPPILSAGAPYDTAKEFIRRECTLDRRADCVVLAGAILALE
jgi:hypothetical protein